MTEDPIRCEIDARRVATITLNRPAAHNALNGEMYIAISKMIRDLEKAQDVRLLVIRAIGTNFCAGADLKDKANPAAPSLSQVLKQLREFSRPVVVSIQGACVGAGVAIAAVADIVIVSQNGKFSIPEVRLGFNPAQLIPIFSYAMGPRNTMRYVLGGDMFDAAKAYEIGLVQQISAADKLEETTEQIIDALLAGGPEAIKAAKKTILELSGQFISDEQAKRLDVIAKETRNSEEAAEGRASFKEKRSPSWRL